MALDSFEVRGISSDAGIAEWIYYNPYTYAVKLRIVGTGVDGTGTYTTPLIRKKDDPLGDDYSIDSVYILGLSPSTNFTVDLYVIKNSDGSTVAGPVTRTGTTLGPAPSLPTSIDTQYQYGSFSQTISASNASIVQTAYNDNLPSGVSYSISGTSITFSGTPTQTGSFSAEFYIFGNSQDEYVTVSFDVLGPKPVWSTSTVDSFARVGTAYSSWVYAPYANNYSIVSGSLPAGLGGTGDISGTPTTRGTSTFTIRASNDSGYVDAEQTIRVYARLPEWSDSSIANNMRVGTAYLDSVAATYASGYSTSGSIPGITFPSGTSGTVSGTPTTANTYTVTVFAYNLDNESVSIPRTLTVMPRLPVWTDQTLTLTGKVGQAYSDSVAANYAASYEVGSGTLPPGLTLNTATGALTGTPTTANTYTFTLSAKNASNEPITTNSFSLVIAPSGGKVKVFNGSTWVDGRTVYVWNGSSWVESPLYVNTNSGWTKSVSN